MKKVRHPKYAGTFYSNSSKELNGQIESCFRHRFGPGKVPENTEKGSRSILGAIVPHAGYVYSGPIAAHAFYRFSEEVNPEVIVLFGPNHTGRGNTLSILNEGIWRTPLGDIEVDSEIANQIIRESNMIYADDVAHAFEHSIEVQLPFLQYIYDQAFRIVPICFLMQDFETSREVGEIVARIIENRNVIMIASTDLTHYEPHEIAKQKDEMVIDAVLNLDEEKLNDSVESHSVSMCGFGPAVALITATKKLGAKSTKLLSYRSSGDMIGDFSKVVGYASILILK